MEDAMLPSKARSGCTSCYCCKGNSITMIPVIKSVGIQNPTTQSCVPACKKMDGAAAWLVNGVGAAFFSSLKRCSCILIDTKEDAEDIQLLAPASRIISKRQETRQHESKTISKHRK